jgi:hypothetical protein
MKINKSGNQGRIGMVLLAQSILNDGKRDDDARSLAKEMREFCPEENVLIERLEGMGGVDLEEISSEKMQEVMASSVPAEHIKVAERVEQCEDCGEEIRGNFEELEESDGLFYCQGCKERRNEEIDERLYAR